MHSELLNPVWCAHCKRFEDLSVVVSTMPNNHNGGVHTAVPLSDAAVVPDELALEGRSCSRCAEEIYRKTGNLRDAAPAGTGGSTPLHHAARSGNMSMLFHLVTLLGLEAGHERVAEVLRKANDRRETALHMAVGVGHRDMVKLLLWVDPGLVRIPCGDTSLIYQAVSQGDQDVAQELHHAFGRRDDVSYSGPSRQNALHAAVLHGVGMTRMVLDWNKDLSTQKDQKGSTPLHFAVSVAQRTRIPTWCFRHTWFRNLPTSFQRKVSNVPLWPLLDAKPSMAYQPDTEGLLPVHVAAATDRMVAVQILLMKCPRCMGLRDNQGRTFLHVAVQHKGFSVVQYASQRPELAPIMNVQDDNGNTALHLAVNADNLRMFCYLLANREVSLNLRNDEGQTALDLARSSIREGFFYGMNRDRLIYRTLINVGARHSSCRWDEWSGRQGPGAETEQIRAGELENQESAKLTDSSRTLAIGSVLITTMTFSATFARLPGYKVDPATGVPTVAGSRWSFDAFVVASALAFILSSAATVGLMYSGIAMIELPIRRRHFLVSLFFVSSAVTCLTIAFALGVYIVLAPVSRGTAIAICTITPLLLIYRHTESLQKLVSVSRPLRERRGFWAWLRWAAGAILFRILIKFWPFALIFVCAGPLRN